ncbi:ATP-binding cassette domain-containing protein [Treponema denticola]|uniref:ABC transporter ATP-binding protein n=1 Tax=Treponema denticola TaxID=158 RepID=UPI0020A47A8D|nr:ATP-binding cassette domain-containing protein [Treponema denticola]UTC94319.1 ATP-binding cassette domain-containing protein [Treponema denticola]
MIELKNIDKTYKTQERRFGLLGIVKDMFKPDYSEVKALTDISFKIENNENVAIVGKNGSGKSTLIKIISGILRPTSGEILFNHKNIYENQKEYKRNIGVIFGQRSQLYQNMIFRESLELFRLIYKIEKNEANKRLNTLIDLFKLENLLKKPIREMSLGQKMKCEIALVLFHNPKILLLDEPTIGLDLEVKEQFYNLIKTYKQSNDIILILISHNSDDIINLSERLLVLNNGKLQEDIRTHEFIESYNKSKIVTLLYKKHINLTEKLQSNFNIIDKDLQKNSISFEVDKKITMEEIFNSLDDKENIYDIKIENEDFSKILLNYYKDKKTE